MGGNNNPQGIVQEIEIWQYSQIVYIQTRIRPGEWFGLVGFYGISAIVGYLLLNLFLYKYIKCIWYGVLGFYDILTIVGYLMPNPVYTYIYKYMWFDLFGFYGISTFVGYLMPNPPYIYIYIYNLLTHFVDNILKRVRDLYLHTVKWFLVLVYNSHNSTSVIKC